MEAHSDGPGRGSEFIVRLPLARTAASGRAGGHDGPERPSAALAGRRILVVDDNRDAADSLAMLLQLLGAVVHTAYDGPSALEAVRVHRPSVLFLDLGMPRMDGYAVAAQVRGEAQYQDVTLIALTGWGQEEDRRRTREAGFDHHLTKPPGVQAIQQLVASLPSRSIAS